MKVSCYMILLMTVFLILPVQAYQKSGSGIDLPSTIINGGEGMTMEGLKGKAVVFFFYEEG